VPCSLSSNREPRNPRTREPKPKTQIRSPGFVFSINHYANSLSGCPIKPQTARTSQIYGRLNNLPDPSKSLARTKTPNSVQNCWGKSREIAKTIKYRLAGIQEQQHPASPANESKRMQIKIFPLSRRLQDSQYRSTSLPALDGAIKSMCSFTQTFHLPGPPRPSSPILVHRAFYA